MRAAFAEYLGALAVESSSHAESLEDVRAALRTGGGVLAYLGTQPVGSARFRLDLNAGEVYVGRLSVMPAHRRRGVASAMMRFLEDVARERGRGTIRIQVRESLPSNVRLYQSLGYALVSVEPHARGADNVWTMRKDV